VRGPELGLLDSGLGEARVTACLGELVTIRFQLAMTDDEESATLAIAATSNHPLRQGTGRPAPTAVINSQGGIV
jgi:hypothetical protein